MAEIDTSYREIQVPDVPMERFSQETLGTTQTEAILLYLIEKSPRLVGREVLYSRVLHKDGIYEPKRDESLVNVQISLARERLAEINQGRGERGLAKFRIYSVVGTGSYLFYQEMREKSMILLHDLIPDDWRKSRQTREALWGMEELWQMAEVRAKNLIVPRFTPTERLLLVELCKAYPDETRSTHLLQTMGLGDSGLHVINVNMFNLREKLESSGFKLQNNRGAYSLARTC